LGRFVDFGRLLRINAAEKVNVATNTCSSE
jgi:hypothetical protein